MRVTLNEMFKLVLAKYTEAGCATTHFRDQVEKRFPSRAKG